MCVLISVIMAVLYVGAAIWNRWRNDVGKENILPDSISAMVYDLGKPWRWLWSVWLWTVTLLMLPSLMETLPFDLLFIGFFTAAHLLFTGAMPLVEGRRNTLHNILGTAAGILSQVCVLLISPWWLLLWLLMVLAWVWTTKDCPYKVFDGRGVFLAETVCAASVYGALLSTI